jgi:uncharacterized protein (DUF58 family)
VTNQCSDCKKLKKNSLKCYLFFFDLRFCLYLNVDIFFFNQSQGAGVTRRVPHVEQELSGKQKSLHIVAIGQTTGVIQISD